MKLPTELSLEEVNALIVHWGEQAVALGNDRGYSSPERIVDRLAELTAMRNQFHAAYQHERDAIAATKRAIDAKAMQ